MKAFLKLFRKVVWGTIPKGIEHLEYNVDLSLLDGTVIVVLMIK